MVAEISAEMLLEYLYPGMEDQWKVNNCGGFYRNYQSDIKSLDSKNGEISLSRNGYLHFLPSTFISPRDEIISKKNRKEQSEKLKERQQILSEAFKPLDTFAFRKRLEIERNTSEGCSCTSVYRNISRQPAYGQGYDSFHSGLHRTGGFVPSLQRKGIFPCLDAGSEVHSVYPGT